VTNNVSAACGFYRATGGDVMNIHIALNRYAALSGSMKAFSKVQRKCVAADRAAYAKHYAADDDRPKARACLAIRFMNEVCKVPLAQARACVIAIIHNSEQYKFDYIPCAAVIASEFVNENRNVVVAEASIALYVAAAEESPWAPFWRNVLEALRYGQPVDGSDEGPAVP
jgi:hypothetical protein